VREVVRAVRDLARVGSGLVREAPDLARLVSWFEHDLPDVVDQDRDPSTWSGDHVHEV
jgi:hypothetical protein